MLSDANKPIRLSDANKPIRLSVALVSVIMLFVVAPAKRATVALKISVLSVLSQQNKA